MTIRYTQWTVTLTGATGSAQSTDVVIGEIFAVHLNYGGTTTGNEDVTLTTNGSASPSETILTVSNNVTDVWKYPRLLADDAAGADLTGWYDRFAVCDHLVASVADSQSGVSVIVTVVYRA